MSFVKEALSATIGEIGKVVDVLYTSEEEKLRIELELQSIMNKHEQLLVDGITRRWEADANSSKLARNVRPITLIVLLGTFLFMALVDSLEAVSFTLNGGYMSVIESLLMVVFLAYFGGRSVEKVMEMREDNKTERAIINSGTAYDQSMKANHVEEYMNQGN